MLTATCLINGLPSYILGHRTCYEFLLRYPTYQHMKAFGCLAFAAHPSRKIDKVQQKGVLYLFLGYSPTQKGHKFLNLLT